MAYKSSIPLDASSIIAISNDATAQTLHRISYNAFVGQWQSLPRSQIAPGDSASFVVGAGGGTLLTLASFAISH